MKPEGTEKGRPRRVMEVPVQARRVFLQEAQCHKRRDVSPRGDERVNASAAIRRADPTLPRKASGGQFGVPVPETDTGGWGEKPKALERILLKELCKLTP